ncbi:MAG: DUF4836 family protein [Prevotella sp.]|nr:DUF4836 family protein [Prevotella sp.]
MKRISFVMTMLVALLLLASCSKKQAAKLIPEDALMVMRFDVTKMQEKSGLSGDKSALKDKFKDFLDEADMDRELREKLLDIVDDPTASGIDFTEPVYFYAGGDIQHKVDIGFVGSMASEGDFEDLLEKIAEEESDLEVEEGKGGVKYIAIHGTALVFNGDWIYVGQSDDVDDTIDELLERADGNGNIEGTPAFEQMEQKDGLMQMLFQGAGIEAIKTREIKELKKMFPDKMELKDMASLVDFVLNDGEMLLTAETIALSDEVQKYVDKYDKTFNKISDEQAKYVSGHALTLFVNTDIDKYFKMIKPMLKEVMDREEMETVDNLLEGLDGTVSLDFYGIDEDGQPKLSVYVGSKNADAVNFVVQNSGDSLTYNGANEYLIPVKEYDWYSETYELKGYNAVGYRDGQSYFVTNPDYIFETPDDKFPTSELKGKGFFARFNFACLDDYIEMMGEDTTVDLISKITDTYECAEAYYEGNGKGVFRITTKSKKTNPVQALFELIEEFMD